MCANRTTQHIEDLKLDSALLIAVDESSDINDTAQVSLFRFMSHSGPKEELLGLLNAAVRRVEKILQMLTTGSPQAKSPAGSSAGALVPPEARTPTAPNKALQNVKGEHPSTDSPVSAVYKK
ncbi:hypothetical protein HUJ04_000526 [Dendroctonus ponderosae]|nr:hypothetical protein HUJ04_000526 [Dendroctonus ponderosae]